MRARKLTFAEAKDQRRTEAFLGALMAETDGFIAAASTPPAVDWRGAVGALAETGEIRKRLTAAVQSLEIKQQIEIAILGGLALAVWAQKRRNARLVGGNLAFEGEATEALRTIAKTIEYIRRTLKLDQSEAEALRLLLVRYDALIAVALQLFERTLIDRILSFLVRLIERSGAGGTITVIDSLVTELGKQSASITKDLVTSLVDSAYSQHIRDLVGGDGSLRYATERDERVRPQHRAMEGFVAAGTDPIWEVWEPLNGWGCRCKLIPLGARPVRGGDRPFGDPPRFVKAIERDAQYGYIPGVLIPVYPDVGFDSSSWTRRIRSYGATRQEEYQDFLERRDRYIAGLDNRKVA